MEDELSKLIRIRGVLKAQTTRFDSYLAGVLSNQNVTQDVITQVQIRTDNFESILDKFNNIQLDIECLQGDAENNDFENERSNFEQIYFNLLSAAKKLISDNAKNKEQAGISKVVPEEGYINKQGIQAGNEIKLPALQIPVFHGSYEEYNQFHDIFKSVIDSNANLSEVQKLYYLKGALRGIAAETIQALDVSATNYKVAWDLLQERFSNKNLTIFSHLKGLFNLPSVQRESGVKIRNLLDSYQRHLRALEALNENVEGWNTVLVFIISQKLDPVSYRGWEEAQSKNTVPKLKDLTEFLKKKCDLLEKIQTKDPEIVNANSKFKPKVQSHSFINAESKCLLCKGDHAIFGCADFLKLSVNRRCEEVKRLNLCINCLKPNHFGKNCKLQGCKKCGKKHNSLLHFEKETVSNQTASSANSGAPNTGGVVLNSQSAVQNQGVLQTLLSTAKVKIFDSTGKVHDCRALLDCGSQSNFITTDLCIRLNLKKSEVNLQVMGLGLTESSIKFKTEVMVGSKINSYATKISCLLVEEISGQMPNFEFKPSVLDIPKNLKLADPGFANPGKVQLLLGAGIFWSLLSTGQIKLGINKPILQKTLLGWILSGPIFDSQTSGSKEVQCNFNFTLQEQIAQFWELEEPVVPVTLESKENQMCERHFSETVERNVEGRFVVSLPFKRSPQELGDSKSIALKRFLSLEKKFSKNEGLKREYTKFMCEYMELGHMTVVDENRKNDNPSYFLPHHAVLKEDSLTTKIRVVFDGSSCSSSGLSLNDLLCVGPVLQDDILSVLLRFRVHSVVMTADITKMYRQVLVHPNERNLQQIFWRGDALETLKIYTLNTVTYGTTSGSYLAIRALQELGHEVKETKPEVSEIILKSFYVDDLLMGVESTEKAIQLQKELTEVLASGKFELRKWNSNKSSILEHIKNSDPSKEYLEIGNSEGMKTLGLLWNANGDYLSFKVKQINNSECVSKRSILSNISQIFDPLGVLSPCIILAKIILQRLWQYKLSWDESIPTELYTLWKDFRESLSRVNRIRVPRQVVIGESVVREIHGFSDASQSAYAAAVYLRSADANGNTMVRLLVAKTKVAPLKVITIPRLELCGALLLAKLVEKVIKSLDIQIHKCSYWCDSEIVLSWIKTEPNKLNTFVANRICQIQSLTEQANWFYVNTRDNPADVASRGMSAEKILKSEVWWVGPKWLSLPHCEWPLRRNAVNQPEVIELKAASTLLVVNKANGFFKKFSCFRKMTRVIAYCKRFVKNTRALQCDERKVGTLEVSELLEAEVCLIKWAQQETFIQEINNLKRNLPISKNSKLVSLNPFLDMDGILRVGGRLGLSPYSYDKRHPIILPNKHILTKLIIMHYHVELMHSGAQALLATLREKYWPIHGKREAKLVVRTCVKCFRVRPIGIKYLMGELPEVRVNRAFPFQNCGVDFAGPFILQIHKGRGSKSFKAYVCLFVCMATKAIHLEVVSDLSTEAFVATLRRFSGRRGKPSHIYSDNATNFVGSNKELRKLHEYLKDELNQSKLQAEVSSLGITWHFIPPRSPNFGGIWEAGIKSTKSHLFRVLGNTSLTYELFQTALIQIEAVLNSRPLSSMSDDPKDQNPLTPAHFLIGRILTSVPDPSVVHIKENRLGIYQHLQKIVQHFWRRWSLEYVSELQQRLKWRRNGHQLIKVGCMVVIKDDNTPPLLWKLGRVVEVAPGKDKVVRVVLVRTSGGLVKVSMAKICILPIEDNL